jgi:4-amino-4-deoxy-L-arabinose transferase-like glycosyltransferase
VRRAGSGSMRTASHGKGSVRNFSNLAGTRTGHALFGVAEDVTRSGQRSRHLDRESVRCRLGASLSRGRIAALLREHWLLLAILFLGAAVRLYAFGSVPAGFNQDEASTGYDGYALLHYGIDRSGFHYPVFLVGFGSGMSALPSYLAMPFLLVFGVSAAAVRAPNILIGILALPAFYLLVRRTGDKTLALLATFLLAISPWHVMDSRWTLAGVLPNLVIFGVLALCRGRENPRSLLWAAVFFALTLYEYAPAYLFIPVFLALASVFFLRNKPASWRPFVAAGALFGVLALPIVLTVAVNQFKLGSIETPLLSMPRLPVAPRYQMVSTLFGSSGATSIGDNLRTFLKVLAKGNDGLIWNAIPGYGYLYRFALPLAVLGVIATFLKRRFWTSDVDFFFLAWLLAGVVLAAAETVNINRINVVFIPIIYFAAVGIRAFAAEVGQTFVRSRALAASRIVLMAFVAYYCVSFAYFTRDYFGASYRAQIGDPFFAHFGEAINRAAAHTTGPLCITDRVNEPYIFVLFYRKIDPHIFAQTVQYEDAQAQFRSVATFDRYTFGLDRCNPTITQGYVADQTEASRIDRRRFSTRQIGRYVVGLRR